MSHIELEYKAMSFASMEDLDAFMDDQTVREQKLKEKLVETTTSIFQCRNCQRKDFYKVLNDNKDYLNHRYCCRCRSMTMDIIIQNYEKQIQNLKLVPSDPKDMLGKPIFEDPIISKMKNI
jgi:Zn finger protein HypA/HybF involved in hydrogenase expression